MTSFFIRLLFVFTVLICCFSCESKKDVNLKKVDLFDDKVIHEIDIQSYNANLLTNLKKDKKNKNRLDITNFQACKIFLDGHIIDSVGIRYKGESSYDFQKNAKKSFKISFNKYRKKQVYKNFKNIVLNNELKDPTLMREKLMLDIITSEGLPTPKSAYCKVSFNGELLGLYLMVEDIDNSFLKRQFGNSKGQLYNGKPKATLCEIKDTVTGLYKAYRRKNKKKSQDWSDLSNLISVMNSPLQGHVYNEKLDSIFNSDQCLKLWAINNLFVNVDAYNLLYPHNFMLYFDKKSEKAQWIGYDYNYGFGCWSPNLYYNDVINFKIYHRQKPTNNFPFVNKFLLQNKDNQKKYEAYLRKLIQTKVKSGWLEKRIYTYYSLIRDAVHADELKMTSNDDFEDNIEKTIGDKDDPGAFVPGLIEFIEKRSASVERQLNKNK
jgi:spore coat protein H